MDDLDHAIVAKGHAIEMTQLVIQTALCTFGNLGNSLQSGFQTTESKDDLNHANATNEQAIDSTLVDHLDCARRASTASGNALQKFEWTGSMGDLDDVATKNSKLRIDLNRLSRSCRKIL